MATSTRLHITPLTSDLLPSVLPASIQPFASDISFHTIQTFPESSYGYVTLPTIEAEKFRKKMDGSMLKGKKFRVEVARPQKRPAESADNGGPISGKSSKRQKKEEGVLGGYELTDRPVKRGWTESAGAKKERRKEEKRKRKEGTKIKAQAKSRYTDKPECLFRTRIPPNRLSTAADVEEMQTKKKNKHSKESVVHEFSKTTTYPTFVRSNAEGVPPSATFEEGKGWIDDSGNLKEPVSDRIRSDQFKPGQVPGVKEKRKPPKTPAREKKESRELKGGSLTSTKRLVPVPEDESDDWTSSSGGTSSDDTSESDDDTSSGGEDTSSDDASENDDSASSESEESESSSSEGSQSSYSSRRKAKSTAFTRAGEEDRQQSSLEAADEQPPADVHPLEALYKRSASDSAENKPSSNANAQFSFFGNSDIGSEDEDGKLEEPYTPYTKRDMEERWLRSGAPTPDTGLAPRHLRLDESDDEGDDAYSSTPVPKPKSAMNGEESDFAKWFWENRGDNNRAWKKRRREASKEARQRENRRKGMKGRS